MGKWVCKECGDEVQVHTQDIVRVIYSLDEDGCIDDHIEDVDRESYQDCYDDYFCTNCSNDSAELEDIAEWKD